MAVFKCKMCGGDLTITAADKVVACEYCGTAQTVPSADSEKKMTLFNRANRLRMNSEFDKAAGLYENIVAEFPEEAEAYWGLCLCNYGIEYVDDPATGEKKPTCHRASFEKLISDENYELAMEYADVAAQRVYRREAQEIDRINGEILALSRSEKPYDVFICYKETDEKGERTPDSVLAQDIYDALTAKGYKVFFSRITLEDKLGLQYEPYIFAALNSAKVMLSVGTKYEYFHAVWVKNEWGRFLRLAAKNKSKILIPCYKNMDPYDMPDEFKGLQAQDLGKLGAMQDLTRGVEKLLGGGAYAPAAQPVQSAAPSVAVAPLLKRAFIFLEDAEWKSADEYAEKVLDNDPENGEAYFCKMLAKANVRKPADFPACTIDMRADKDYQKALRFGDDSVKKVLLAYAPRIEELRRAYTLTQLEPSYQQVAADIKTAKTVAHYESLLPRLEALNHYKDADAMQQFCRDKIVQLRNSGTLTCVFETKSMVGELTVVIDRTAYRVKTIDYLKIEDFSVPYGSHTLYVEDSRGKRSASKSFALSAKSNFERVYVTETSLGYKVN